MPGSRIPFVHTYYVKMPKTKMSLTILPLCTQISERLIPLPCERQLISVSHPLPQTCERHLINISHHLPDPCEHHYFICVSHPSIQPCERQSISASSHHFLDPVNANIRQNEKFEFTHKPNIDRGYLS